MTFLMDLELPTESVDNFERPELTQDLETDEDNETANEEKYSKLFLREEHFVKKKMEENDEKGDIRNVPKQIIKEFIAIYKDHPALWQKKNKDLYGSTTLKYKGYQAMLEVWKKYDADANIKMVKNKIQSLRGSFRKELKKIQHSQKSGSRTENIVILNSQLWYFSLMTFLMDQELPTESVENFETPELKQDLETHKDNENGERYSKLILRKDLFDTKKMEGQDEKDDIRYVPKEIIKEFILMYKAHPALWQIKNKDLYGNRTLKYKGYQAMLAVWKKYDADANIKLVKNKIQSLRGSFRKELKKIQNSQKSGSGTEDIIAYNSQLWYFSLMTFLMDQELPTDSVDNFKRPDLTQDSETHQDNETVNEKRDVKTTAVNVKTSSDKYIPAKKKRKEEDEEKIKFLKAYTDALGAKETENDAFGKFIAKKFDNISNPEQRMYAESLITQIANYAILNKLTQFTEINKKYSPLTNTGTPLRKHSSSTQPAMTSEESDEAASPCAYYVNVACYETIESEND